MRISSIEVFNIANVSIANASAAASVTNQQLSSGQRVLNPSDDPVASTQILSLETELASIEQFENNIDIATNNLTIEETILDSVNDLIVRIQELAVQAGNTATLSVSEYQTIASEVDSRTDELQNLLNTQNANGDFIFGGFRSSSAPFTGNAITGFEYNGDDGQQFIRVANNTSVASSDSGRDIFVDIPSEQNTFTTSISPANTSVPPLSVTVGNVIDQSEYDAFYPDDLIVSFNPDTNFDPPRRNFSILERSSGQAIVENQLYVSGADIEVNGVRFQISGIPVSGTPAVPATQTFGSDAPQDFTNGDFTTASQSFEIVVNGRTETFVLDTNITSTVDLAAALNDTTGTDSNADKLARLGLVATPTGISQVDGVNFTLRNSSSAAVDEVLGLAASNSIGVTSIDGELEKHGDEVFVDSSDSQDILTTLAKFSEALKNYDGSAEARPELETVVNATIGNLGNAQTSVLEVTSQIGARLNTLESTADLQLDARVLSEDLLSSLRGVDYAEATARLAIESLILEAAQASFIRISQLTLFAQL